MCWETWYCLWAGLGWVMVGKPTKLGKCKAGFQNNYKCQKLEYQYGLDSENHGLDSEIAVCVA